MEKIAFFETFLLDSRRYSFIEQDFRIRKFPHYAFKGRNDIPRMHPGTPATAVCDEFRIVHGIADYRRRGIRPDNGYFLHFFLGQRQNPVIFQHDHAFCCGLVSQSIRFCIEQRYRIHFLRSVEKAGSHTCSIDASCLVVYGCRIYLSRLEKRDDFLSYEPAVASHLHVETVDRRIV